MTKTISLRNFDFFNLSDKGLERENNEDYLAYFDTFNGHVFVVCDGMGGHQGGEVASKIAVEAIGEYFNTDYQKNPFEAVENAISYANKKTFEHAKQNAELFGMGTTMVMALIRDDMVYYGHAGDSRLYAFSENRLSQLTRDHSYVNQLVDENIITKKEAETHPRSNEITKALGLNAHIEPDVTSAAFLPNENDILLLCSDGLNNMLRDKYITQALSTNNNIEQKALELVAKAIKNGGEDNITVQLIHFYNINRNYTPKAISLWEKIQQSSILHNRFVQIMAFLIVVFSIYFGFFNQESEKETTIKHNIIISKGHKTTDDGLLMIYPYKIKADDELELIAENFNLDINELKILNPNINKLNEGMHLKVPIQDIYIVQGDDEIELICAKYNLDPIDIMQINDFCQNKPTVGKELIIPLAKKETP